MPSVLFAVSIGGVFARIRKRPARHTLALASGAGFFLGAALAFVAAYPDSGFGVAIAALVPGALSLVVLRDLWPRDAAPPRLPLAAVGLVAAAVGAGAALSLRADLPATQPVGAAFPTSGDAGAVVTVRVGAFELIVDARLGFTSRSPDRFWTIFAPDGSQVGDERSVQEVRSTATATEIRVTTELPRAVYSHLNAYSEVNLKGEAERLFVTFSPCPDARIEVLLSDYPVGRPARLAYLDPAGTFHVVEASSGEKGPFHELGSGPLRRGDPLSVTFHDGERPLVRVTWFDWSAQASTQLSPTAGWGLPENAFEFRRTADGAWLYCTLAATSVGRGWDSVGHSAGVYLNRVRIEAVK